MTRSAATPARAASEPGRSCAASLPLLTAIGGGLLLGLAGLDPRAWLLAWLGVIATSWALASERSAARAVLGLVIGGLLTRACWLWWSTDMAAAMLPGDPTAQMGLAIGFVTVMAVPVVGALAAVAIASIGTRGWIRVALPTAWVVAERVQSRWTSVSSDWIFTQLEVEPMMEALHAFGLVAATWACLLVAASFGEALAHRRRALAIPGAIALVVLLLAPPLPPDDPNAVAGIGVVHMPDGVQMPAVDLVDDDLELVVWPETSFNTEPAVVEGRVSNVRFGAVSAGTHHLVGVETPSRYGRQNMALAVTPDGQITEARAKKGLLPFFERPFLGLGNDELVPGEAVPVLDVAGRRLVSLICGEILQRELVAEGVEAGGEVISVMARDRFQGGSELADRHVLTKLRLRAIEYGRPAVYASIGGRASIVSARGEVLARSDADAPPGVLTWTPAGGADDRIPELDPPVTVLFSERTPRLRPDCAPGFCRYQTLEQPSCPDEPVRTLVVSAHGDGERIGGLTATELARRIECFHADLIVLDACYSASAPVLSALRRRSDALVVAVPAFLAAHGLHYERVFYSASSAQRRADAVHTEPESPLFVGRVDPRAIEQAKTWVATASADELRARVVSWVPTLVVVDVAPVQSILVPADWRRIGHPPESLMRSR